MIPDKKKQWVKSKTLPGFEGEKKCREACARNNIVLFYFVNCSDACNSTTDDLSSSAWITNSFYFPLLSTYTPLLLEGILCVIYKGYFLDPLNISYSLQTYSYVHDKPLSTFSLTSGRVWWAKWRTNKVCKAQKVEWSSTELASL